MRLVSQLDAHLGTDEHAAQFREQLLVHVHRACICLELMLLSLSISRRLLAGTIALKERGCVAVIIIVFD